MKILCTEEQLKQKYFSVQCNLCGWEGCSCECKGGEPLADTGDFNEYFCPECGALEPDKITENIFE